MKTLDIAIDLDQFKEEGYAVVRKLLQEEDLRPLREEYSALLDSLAEKWYVEGKIKSAYHDLPFGQRLMRLIEEGQPVFEYFDISLPPRVTEDTPIHLGPAVFNFLRNRQLLDAVEYFIGPEIYSNPVQHVRIKPPERLIPPSLWSGLIAAVGWHQDLGVVEAEADGTDMLSVWVAITDATAENGCLQIIPGSHKGELRLHCLKYAREGFQNTRMISIPENVVGLNRLPIPMEAGDVLFFNKKLMHASLQNTSDRIRWSLDLRYNPIGQPTGRPWLPGFIARSRSHPEIELRDHRKWTQLWLEARARLATDIISGTGRWRVGDPRCA